MAKIKAENQIGNLTPDHLKSKIASIFLFVGGVQFIVKKLLMRAITLLQSSSQSEVCTQSY